MTESWRQEAIKDAIQSVDENYGIATRKVLIEKYKKEIKDWEDQPCIGSGGVYYNNGKNK